MQVSEGIFVDEIKFIRSHATGVSILYAQVDDNGKEIHIQTTDSKEDTQHDFTLDKEEWEIIKRIIDIQLRRRKSDE